MQPHWKPLYPLCSWSGYGPGGSWFLFRWTSGFTEIRGLQCGNHCLRSRVVCVTEPLNLRIIWVREIWLTRRWSGRDCNIVIGSGVLCVSLEPIRDISNITLHYLALNSVIAKRISLWLTSSAWTAGHYNCFNTISVLAVRFVPTL